MNSQILKRIIFFGLFAIPFIPFLFSSSFFFPFITFKAFVFRFIVEIIFFAWVLLAIFDADYRPKKSVILFSVLSFLAVIGVADLAGVAPLKSFWSNFERMEGFVSLLHVGGLFLVIGSVFKSSDWKLWWNVSLFASAIMAFYALFQVIGIISPNQSGTRVDGTFGNTIYLAVYMLFHIFVALLFMWRERKDVFLRWVYGLLILLELFILYHTATRGAILGIIGGFVIIAILTIFNRQASRLDKKTKSSAGKEDRFVRKVGIAGLLAIVVLVGGFFSLRNADFVVSNPVLSRFSSLTLEELKTQGRYFIWPVAFEGFKDRPILGWGQENFSYVFQEHYGPEMYHLEPWFDRAHNIFLDWAVAGGLLGLISYLLMYVAFLFLVWRRQPESLENNKSKEDTENLSYMEKSILTGLLSAYFFHNFFVFDHLVSYILFFSLLAYIHSKNSSSIEWLQVTKEHTSIFKKTMIPVLAVLLIGSIYFVNFKPIQSNFYLIEVLKAKELGQFDVMAEYFEKSFNSSVLGRGEVAEQITFNTISILRSDIPMADRNDFFVFGQKALLNQAKNFPEDARTQFITGAFLSATGSLDEALVYLERAKELMPGKHTIHLEIANVYLEQGDHEKVIEILRYVGELSPGHKEEMDGYIRELTNS